MGDQTGPIEIARDPQEVFDIRTASAKLPAYLPTVKEAIPVGERKMLMRGEAHGHL
jgi:hypothetical protein